MMHGVRMTQGKHANNHEGASECPSRQDNVIFKCTSTLTIGRLFMASPLHAKSQHLAVFSYLLLDSLALLKNKAQVFGK